MGVSLLKSDQNGIEIVEFYYVFDDVEILKSDQNGIEIKQRAKDSHRTQIIKIRPKWD